jgi:hypothetical protein
MPVSGGRGGAHPHGSEKILPVTAQPLKWVREGRGGGGGVGCLCDVCIIRLPPTIQHAK